MCRSVFFNNALALRIGLFQVHVRLRVTIHSKSDPTRAQTHDLQMIMDSTCNNPEKLILGIMDPTVYIRMAVAIVNLLKLSVNV